LIDVIAGYISLYNRGIEVISSSTKDIILYTPALDINNDRGIKSRLDFEHVILPSPLYLPRNYYVPLLGEIRYCFAREQQIYIAYWIDHSFSCSCFGGDRSYSIAKVTKDIFRR